MTLITYPTRIHFADGVLEEALRSELDAHGLLRPMILGEADEADSDLSQRIYAALPRRARPLHVTIAPQDTKYTTSHRAEAETRRRRPDVIVAYGSARAIAYARKCRHALYQSDCDHGMAVRPVDIFAVPGVDGLPNPCRLFYEPGQTLLDAASRSGLPRILICDPTVTDGATAHQASCAAVDALSRAIEAYLSSAYNPPADGMALDGARRAVRAMRTPDDVADPSYRRELMAAGLNASLSQQKGIGPTQLISDALREPYGNRLASGALARIILPVVLGTQAVPGAKGAAVMRMLDLTESDLLDLGVEALLTPLPLPHRLSDLGLTHDDVIHASDSLRDRVEAQGTAPQDIMESVL